MESGEGWAEGRESGEKKEVERKIKKALPHPPLRNLTQTRGMGGI